MESPDDPGRTEAEGPAGVTLPPGLDLVRSCGRGKMATVYLARETELGRLVAVKVLRPEVAADDTARMRFEREARSAASLAHPNVVSVFRFGRLDDGTPYQVMTYVQGRTLADRLRAQGSLPEAEARTLLLQVASALAAAHRKGIVHRDVRPGNVLIEEETGRALLADFGIAAVLEGGGGGSEPRLTKTGQVLGDPQYASPEQLLGERVTGQADVYSLGILGYELLTGEGPYDARSMRELITAHLTGEPRPLARLRPGVSQDLADVLLRCLAREPAHRPRAEDVVRRLERQAERGAAPGSDAGEGLGLRRRRMPQFVGVALAGAVGFVGFAGLLVEQGILTHPAAFKLALNAGIWGFLAATVVVWFHGEKGQQKVPRLEMWALAAMAAAWLATSAMLLLR